MSDLGITKLEVGDKITIGNIPGVFTVENAVKNEHGDTMYIDGHKYDQHGDPVEGSLFQIPWNNPASGTVRKVG